MTIKDFIQLRDLSIQIHLDNFLKEFPDYQSNWENWRERLTAAFAAGENSMQTKFLCHLVPDGDVERILEKIKKEQL